MNGEWGTYLLRQLCWILFAIGTRLARYRRCVLSANANGDNLQTADSCVRTSASRSPSRELCGVLPVSFFIDQSAFRPISDGLLRKIAYKLKTRRLENMASASVREAITPRHRPRSSTEVFLVGHPASSIGTSKIVTVRHISKFYLHQKKNVPRYNENTESTVENGKAF